VQHALQSERTELKSAEGNFRRPQGSRWADRAILLLLVIIALAMPFSNRLAVHAFRLAVLIWAVKLITYRPKLRPQPLALPLLLFLVLTAISSALSYEPQLSWGRMRTVSLLLLVPLITQSLTSLKQVRVLVSALVISTLLLVAYTGWQYTFGIGVALKRLAPESSLARAGWLPGDTITMVNGHRLYSPSSLRHIVKDGPPTEVLRITMRRNAPPEWHELQYDRATLLEAGLLERGALARAHPVRAQGVFKHYVPFSEFLMIMGAICFGMVASDKEKLKILFAIAFLAISAALVATVTRATLAALAVACLLVLWLKARWPARALSSLLVLSVLVLGSFWFQRERGTGWYEARDAGSQYRELMWKDGLRLAAQHPWFGVGMDSIHRHWQEWNIRAYQRFPHLKSHFHSTYIQLAAECGLAVLAVWLWFLAAYLAMLWKLIPRTDPGRPRFENGFVLGLRAATVAFIATGAVHYTLGDAEVMIVFWFLAGLSTSVLIAQSPANLTLTNRT
jgi:hypothetical protein